MANFSYLLDHCRGNSTDLLDFKFILELNVDAEKLIHQRISIAMMSLRQGNEEFVKFLARKNHIDLHRQLPDGKTSARSAVELIDEIVEKGNISPHIKECLHTIRQVGNEATHNARYDDFNQAQLQFQNAYEMLQSYFLFHFAPKHFRSKNYEWLEPPQTASTTNENNKDVQKTNHDLVVARLFTQAEIDRKAKRYQEAKAGYKAVLAQDPNHGRSLFQLGMMYEKDRAGADFSKAIECYEKAVALGESYAHASLADCLLMTSTDTEHRERIFELLEKGLSFDNPSNRAYIVYVKIYEQGLLGQAVDLSLALDYAKKAKEANFPKSEDIIARIEKKLAQVEKSEPEPKVEPKVEPISVGTKKKSTLYEFVVEYNNKINENNSHLKDKLSTLYYPPKQLKDELIGNTEATVMLSVSMLEFTRLCKISEQVDRCILLANKSIQEFNDKVSSYASQQPNDKQISSDIEPISSTNPIKQTPSDFDDLAIHHASQSLAEQKKVRLKELREKHFGFNLAEKSYTEWIKEAHTHKSAKRYHEAIECFEQGLSQYVTTDNQLSLCECYVKVGQYRKAQQLYLKISEENQHSYFHQHAYKMANVGLGDLYFHGLGVEVNPYQALEYYQKANNITKITQAEQAIKNLESK